MAGCGRLGCTLKEMKPEPLELEIPPEAFKNPDGMADAAAASIEGIGLEVVLRGASANLHVGDRVGDVDRPSRPRAGRIELGHCTQRRLY